MTWFDVFTMFLVLSIFIVVVMFLYRSLNQLQTSLSNEEKIALTRRLLTNLTPIALYLVTEAEVKFGEETGQLKRAYVIDQLYARMPEIFKPYITEANLDIILEMALSSAKVMWEENKSTLLKI